MGCDPSARIDFAVITMRDDETDAVLHRMGKLEHCHYKNHTYPVGEIENNRGRRIRIASKKTPGQGQLAAQTLAGYMIEDLDPRWIALVGICGAVPDFEFTLGDVIVASRLHAFILGALKEGRSPQFSDLGGPMSRETEDLIGNIKSLEPQMAGWSDAESIGCSRPKIILRATNFYGNEKRQNETRKTLVHHFRGREARSRAVVTTREVGSSDFLIKDTKTVAGWQKAARHLGGIEMELAGVFEASRRPDKQYPILAVRGISDVVGFTRSGDWTRYACETAGALFAALVRVMPDAFLTAPVTQAPPVVETLPTTSARSGTAGSSPQVRSNIPARGARPFVGRDDLLDQMRRSLDDTGAEKVLVLHGHAGVGKSELASEFARLNQRRYPGGIFFIDASRNAIDIEFAHIGQIILRETNPQNLRPNEAGQRTFYGLGNASTLLIYDNVASPDAVQEWLPRSGMPCHVLITTVSDGEASGWGWPSLRVDPLPREAAVELVERLAGSEIAKRFGPGIAKNAVGLTVQIVNAAVFLLDEQKHGRISKPPDLAGGTAKSFQAVYGRVSTPGRLLLQAAAFLNPQRIPVEELLASLRKGLGWGEAEFHSALNACLDLHLLERVAEPRMHQLFASFLRQAELSADERASVAHIRQAQFTRFLELANSVRANPADIQAAALLMVYPLTCENWAAAGQTASLTDLARVGSALHEIGRFPEALSWFLDGADRASRQDAKTGVDRETLAAVLEGAGYCLMNTGRPEEAMPWLERAIAEWERGAAPDAVNHSGLGGTLHQMGFCLFSAGRFDEACPWFEKAVAEFTQGDEQHRIDHESLASSLHQVGKCMASVGKEDQAIPWFQRAVREAEQGDVHGTVDHASLGLSLHEVGYCLLAAGQPDQAMPWFERAVQESQKGDIYGRIDYRNLGSSMHLVGDCLAGAGRCQEAREWYVQAVEAKERGDVYGRLDHESIAAALRDGAKCLLQLGENELAAEWERKASSELSKAAAATAPAALPPKPQ